MRLIRRTGWCGLAVLLAAWVAAAPAAAQSSAGANDAPALFFPEKAFEFAPVIEGAAVVHDFAVRNQGTAPLLISNVRTGWGCTAVSFPRQIPAGGEGKISIKVDTAGFGGRRLQKSAEVLSNDPKEPVVQLSIAGEVERFAAINPRTLSLRGQAGEKLTGVVNIVPEVKYPFKVLDAKAREGRLRVSLSEVREAGKPAYAMLVENLKTDPGSYNDTVVIKTDSPLQPELDVRVFVYLRAPEPAQKKVQ